MNAAGLQPPETISATGGLPRARRLKLSALPVRLLALGALVALGVLLVAWIKVASWRQLAILEEEFAAIQTEAFYLGVHVRSTVWQLNGALLRFQLSKVDTERQRFLHESLKLNRFIDDALARLSTERERRLALKTRDAFRNYLTNCAVLLESRPKAIRKDTSAQVHSLILEASAPVLSVADELVQAQQAALAGVFVQSERTLGSLQSLSHVSIVAIVGLLAAVSYLLYRAMIAPLRLQLSKTKSVLERQDRLASLGVLAAGVAHEIRNPLTAIKFRLFSLKKALPLGYADQEDLVVIKAEIDRLEKIVKEFLLFARPSEPELTDVTASEILGRVENLLRGQLERRSIELKADIPADAVVRADKNQLEQVLINLVQNAADSIENNGRITMRAQSGLANMLPDRPTPVVIFQVADSGKGIPPEVENRIFDPFFSTKESGTGLGLPIAAGIVERHGGFIQYESHRSRGTVFSVVIPRSPNGSQNSHS